MRRDLPALLSDLSGLPGVGVDAEEVDRWTDPDLRLFTAAEVAHCAALGRRAEGYAGRWCAKEAVVKALAPFAAATMREVEIRSGPRGEPLVHLSPRLSGLDLQVAVSISHTRSIAVAVAVARGPS